MNDAQSAEMQRVLLADPVVATRESTQTLLKRAGYGVVLAADGAAILSVARKRVPRLVLLATKLSDLPSREVLKQLKQDPLLGHIPVVLCSATPTTAEERAAGYDAGADSFLTHPIDEGEFLARLRACLRQSQSVEVLRQRIRQEQALFDTLVNAMPDRIYLKDLGRRFVRINQPMAEAFGLSSAEQAIGRTDADFFGQKHAQQAGHDEEGIMRTGNPMVDQVELEIWLDGRENWVSTTKVPIRNGHGDITGLAGISRDITNRVEADRQVRQFSHAVENSPVTVVITDRAGNIEYTNPNFTTVTGYPAAEVKGLNPRVLKSGEMPPEAYRELWRTISRGGTWRGLFHNKKKNGELYWDDASISPITDGEGQITHYMAIKMDVTARIEAEIELQRAKEAAEAGAKAKSEFLANMSHEIRTPMNGVIGMIGLLLDTPLDPDQKQFAETVRDSADNLLVVINDILDFSKIEAGKMRFEELDFNLVETIEGSLDMHAGRALSQGIELADAVASNVPTLLRGDPGRLRQIFTNLLGNALKFTEQGEVVLRVELEEESPQDAALRFSITDTGIGIPREAQRKLFQSFEQADKSTTRKFGGTGLGLAISKQLVAMMGGEIGVDSEVGRGSTFWFTARFPKQAEGVKPGRAGIKQLFNLRVLVVDDNATNRQILRHQIFAWKMQKGSAAGGHQALKLLREAAANGEPYDLALLDMQMPEMDGMALARAIKADPRIASTRLIMLTSLGVRFSSEELAAVGLDAYLVKPVKQSRLYDTLLDVVGVEVATEKLTEPAAALGNPPALEFGSNQRILLAEDNPVNQKVAVMQLGKLGLGVEVVADGQAALAALSRSRYDLVLMDCQMPVMDGYDASRQIRRMEAESPAECSWLVPIPIVAMTANAMQGDREKCLAAGMNEHVSKPVRIAHLRAALDPLLNSVTPTPPS